MCGRYYVDDETVRKMEELFKQVHEKMWKAENIHLNAGDIHPSDVAPVITADHKELCLRWQRWGFPGFNDQQIIFNARSESALEKTMFKDCVKHRRVVVPAAWFYEWSKNKEKNIFYQEGERVLFMAGMYNRYQDEERFVILTTAANESMKPIHDRMPLLLERDEISKWLLEDGLTEAFLQKTPVMLERKTDYEQMSLFPVENSR